VLLFYTRSDRYTWNRICQPYDQDYLDTFFDQKDEDGRRWKRTDLTGAGIRHGETGQEWRGLDVTGRGRHWAYPPAMLEELDRKGRVHWPKKAGGMPRLKQYPEELPGVPLQDVWVDIPPMHNLSKERLGYPTQKPIALLQRIIEASSNPGDVVFDPFCGCGTAIDAAQHLRRRWIGIDVTYLAVDLICKRLRHSYGAAIADSYRIKGIPTDLEGAYALFHDNQFDFERWAVSIIDAQPNEKQVGDRGIDGRVRFHAGKDRIGQVLVSVKGGRALNPAMVRDLAGTVNREQAEMGILLTLEPSTRGMTQEVAQSSTYTSPLTGQKYPKLQLLTVGELLKGKRPNMPPAILPYFKAVQREGDQLTLRVAG